MLFTEYDLIGYLLTNRPTTKQGLLAPPFLTYQDFKSGKIEAFQDKNPLYRNNIFRVKESVSPEKGLYFIKQPKRLEQEFKQTIFTEASVYKNIPNELKDCFPEIIGFDKAHYILICEHIDYDKFSFLDEKQLNILGLNLKKIHTIFENELTNSEKREILEGYIPTSKPFIFRLDKQTIKSLADGLILIDNKHVQQEANVWLKNTDNQRMLDIISKKWLENTVIHQDLKENNLLLLKNLPPTIKFVDWEMALIGDAYWDLASILFNIFSGISNIKDDTLSEDCKSIFEIGAKKFKNTFAKIYFNNDEDYTTKLTEFTGVFILQKSIIGDRRTLKFAFEILKNIDEYAKFFKKKD